MEMRLCILFILLFAPLVNCSSVSVSTDFDKSASFSNLQTYAWTTASQQSPQMSLDNPQDLSQIKRAIERHLGLKGYRVVTEKPDFLLASHTSVIQRSFSARSSGSRSRALRLSEGTLIVQIFDPDSRKLIWWGNGKLVFGADDDSETKASQINQLVKKIFEEFPPK